MTNKEWQLIPYKARLKAVLMHILEYAIPAKSIAKFIAIDEHDGRIYEVLFESDETLVTLFAKFDEGILETYIDYDRAMDLAWFEISQQQFFESLGARAMQ